MLITTPYKFMWRVKSPSLYWADSLEDIKYIVTLNGKVLGGFMGVNRTFDDDFYYVNYINEEGKYGSWHTHRDSEMILNKR